MQESPNGHACTAKRTYITAYFLISSCSSAVLGLWTAKGRQVVSGCRCFEVPVRGPRKGLFSGGCRITSGLEAASICNKRGTHRFGTSMNLWNSKFGGQGSKCRHPLCASVLRDNQLMDISSICVKQNKTEKAWRYRQCSCSKNFYLSHNFCERSSSLAMPLYTQLLSHQRPKPQQETWGSLPSVTHNRESKQRVLLLSIVTKIPWKQIWEKPWRNSM